MLQLRKKSAEIPNYDFCSADEEMLIELQRKN